MTVELYDTTLRDGAQAEGISFSVQDKLRIAKYLDDFGFHYIFPVHSLRGRPKALPGSKMNV